MKDLHLAATDRTPEVAFAFSRGELAMSGESYPEDAAAFFGPVYQSLKDYVAALRGGDVRFDLRMNYFNSSSAKALMRMFQLLEDAAAAGNRVSIRWHFSPDDDTMQEFGEDFAQDFSHARFELCPAQ
jgi:hypothetical protein